MKAARTPQTLLELHKALQAVPRGFSMADRKFASTLLLFIAERLVNIEKALAKRNGGTRRKPSAWNRFFAAGMEAGKSPKQIGAEWRARKAESP